MAKLREACNYYFCISHPLNKLSLLQLCWWEWEMFCFNHLISGWRKFDDHFCTNHAQINKKCVCFTPWPYCRQTYRVRAYAYSSITTGLAVVSNILMNVIYGVRYGWVCIFVLLGSIRSYDRYKLFGTTISHLEIKWRALKFLLPCRFSSLFAVTEKWVHLITLLVRRSIIRRLKYTLSCLRFLEMNWQRSKYLFFYSFLRKSYLLRGHWNC